MSGNIYNLFYSSFVASPTKVCLAFPNRKFTYRDIFEISSKLAVLIAKDQLPYIGILAHRTLSAYVGILASLQCGKTYVPLNPKFPSRRIAQVVFAANIKTIVADNESLGIVKELQWQTDLTVLAPELDSDNLGNGKVSIIGRREIGEKTIGHTMIEFPTNKAYLLFTSGSTGEPKGIEIGHQNIFDYLNYTQERLGIRSNDNCSQIFDLCFDLSGHDLFLTWMSGATLCIPERDLFNPISFVGNNNLTVWFSVPSVGYYLAKNHFLSQGIFSGLRISLFCGEPLIAEFVKEWEIAAPNSKIENIYGPTECTIGISSYLWERNKCNKVRNGIVSIGKIFPKQKYLIVDEADRPLGKNCEGELLLSGSQVISQYFATSPDLCDKFTIIGNNDPDIYYRTGDIILEDDEGDIYFVKRKDFEFKIRGYRVDEEEVNNAIRKITGIKNVISLPLNGEIGSPTCIVSFVASNESPDEFKLIAECRKLLPDYMVPNRIYVMSEFPLNTNGKINRAYFVDLLNASLPKDE